MSSICHLILRFFYENWNHYNSLKEKKRKFISNTNYCWIFFVGIYNSVHTPFLIFKLEVPLLLINCGTFIIEDYWKIDDLALFVIKYYWKFLKFFSFIDEYWIEAFLEFNGIIEGIVPSTIPL